MGRPIERYYVNCVPNEGEFGVKDFTYEIRDRFKLSVFEKDRSQSVVSTHADFKEAIRLAKLANSAWEDGHNDTHG